MKSLYRRIFGFIVEGDRQFMRPTMTTLKW